MLTVLPFAVCMTHPAVAGPPPPLLHGKFIFRASEVKERTFVRPAVAGNVRARGGGGTSEMGPRKATSENEPREATRCTEAMLYLGSHNFSKNAWGGTW
jgi:hypothetical protein